MQVLGIGCGVSGNSDILLKAALMAVEQAGHDVAMVQAGALALPAGRPGTLPPGTEDDRPWLTEALIACDGLIIAAPVYTRSPAATLKLLVDRAFGPRVDVAAMMRVKAGKQGGDPRYAANITDDRLLKPRVGGLISIGGATSLDWATFGLPLMHMAMFSMHIAVVDQVQILGSALPASIVFDEAAIDRASALGRNVAAELGKSFDEAIYHGAAGVCPVCHCDLIVPHATEAECATCAVRGVLTLEHGQPRLQLHKDGREGSILTLAGKAHHQEEIDAVSAATLPRMPQIPKLRARFDAYQPPSPKQQGIS